MAARTPPSDGYVVIGQLGRAHGVVGEIRAYPTGPSLGQLPTGATIRARGDDGSIVPIVLASQRQVADALLLRFHDRDSREAVTDIVGRVLEIPAEALPQLADDEFYVRDLIGFDVGLSPGGRPLGVVHQVYSGSANDSLEVRADDGTLVLIPFTHDAIVQFDLVARTMQVREDLLGGGDG